MTAALVTGGLGFLGSHLAEVLLVRGFEVTIVDSRTDSTHGARKIPAEVVVADASQYDSDGPFDHVFHLADLAGPVGILPYAGEIGERSIRSAANIWRFAHRCGAKLTMVSSSEVYGRPGRYSENEPTLIYTPYTVRLEYAVAKNLAEISLMNFCSRTGLRANIVRPFNIAGPRQSSRGGFVIPRFFEAAISGEPITVFGNGQQVRTFTHVRDTVDSLIEIATSGVSGEIFNSGNPRNVTTIGDLALRVKERCDSTSEIEYVDPRNLFGSGYAESFDKTPDVAKIRSLIGWSARLGLQDILSDVYSFYRAEGSESLNR